MEQSYYIYAEGLSSCLIGPFTSSRKAQEHIDLMRERKWIIGSFIEVVTEKVAEALADGERTSRMTPSESIMFYQKRDEEHKEAAKKVMGKKTCTIKEYIIGLYDKGDEYREYLLENLTKEALAMSVKSYCGERCVSAITAGEKMIHHIMDAFGNHGKHTVWTIIVTTTNICNIYANG